MHGFVPMKDSEKTLLSSVGAEVVSDIIYPHFSLCSIVKYILMSPWCLCRKTDKNGDVYVFFTLRNIMRI